ncbi:SLC13 family permease [Desulfobacterales bacterium HSG2]|nr:SLC13 family permease [Desulfobacterales bacterium HSG2]
MFTNGYIIYRLLVITKLTDTFVFWSLEKSRGRVNRICLYIIMVTALLSFFIPNAVTVLILLPILKTIEQDIVSQTDGISLSTALTLSVIYGANIGGMGSLIGSPANLLMIGALDLYSVPGREQISFFSWFLWSVPLVTLFAGAAWILIATMAVPKQAKSITIQLEGAANHGPVPPEQKAGALLFFFFLFFWIGESVLKEAVPVFESAESPVCLSFFALFLYFAFIRLGPAAAPLLHPKDMITGVPKRGILFLGLLVLLILIVRFFRLDKQAADVLLSVISPDIPLFAMTFLTVITVIFLTELLSNTVVSTAFFPIAFYVSIGRGISPLFLMIAVSIASTCAFMSPVATPCNALAFGEMKGTSFRKMVVLGSMLNLIGAFLMSVWLQFIIPFIYH